MNLACAHLLGIQRRPAFYPPSLTSGYVVFCNSIMQGCRLEMNACTDINVHKWISQPAFRHVFLQPCRQSSLSLPHTCRYLVTVMQPGVSIYMGNSEKDNRRAPKSFSQQLAVLVWDFKGTFPKINQRKGWFCVPRIQQIVSPDYVLEVRCSSSWQGFGKLRFEP